MCPFLGLSPHEKQPSQFESSPLPEEPRVTFWLLVAAVAVALVVIFVGSAIHTPAQTFEFAFRGQCPVGTSPSPGEAGICVRTASTWWDRVPMTMWFFYAALAATLVMVAPFLIYKVKGRTGQV